MEAEVRATVERFRAGWEALDASAVLATFSADPSLLVWGTDADEEWRGIDELVEPFHQQVAAFSEPRYVWRSGDPMVVWAGRDCGWAAGTIEVTLRTGEQVLSIPMRSTFVVRREEAGWRIAHAHFSVGATETVAEYR